MSPRADASTVPGAGSPPTLALHADASAASVAMLRVGVFLLCAAEAWVLWRQAAPIPPDAWVPFGLLGWLPAAMLDALRTTMGQQALFVAAGLTAVAAAFGIAPRVSLPVATLMFILSQAVPRALQGLVNHAQVPVMLAALVLTLGPSADALVLWPRRRPPPPDGRYQATLVYIVAALCIGYAYIAAHRLAYGGLRLFSDESLLQWFMQRSLSEANPEQALGTRLIRSPWLATAAQFAFPAITALELSAPLCLFFRGYRRVFVPAMLLAHTAIYVLMHISFSQLVALYVVFIDSAAWSPRRATLDAQGIPLPLVVFFDGVCGLCNRFVDFLLRRDHQHGLRFAPLQGSTAESLALPTDFDTVVARDGTRTLVRSDAALAALSRLGGLWAFAAVLGLVPRPLRDAVYRFVAHNRYRWFGRHDSCRLPEPHEALSFLP